MCPVPEARELWEKSLKALELWLKDEGTDINLHEHFMNYLRLWPAANPTLLRSLPFIVDQDDIGNQHIWDGWLCRRWREYQDQIWKQSKSHKSSRRWTSELIKKLWNVAWDMWEQCNDVLHNSSLNQEIILEKDVNDKIRQIYEVGLGQLLRMDFGLMRHPVDHQLQLPLNVKRQWLESISMAVHQKNLHEHGTMLAEQRLMEMWVIQNPARRTPAPIHQRCPNVRRQGTVSGH